MRVPFAIFLLLPAAASAADLAALDAAAGRALFERNWVGAPASTATADGLGPYYTARACVACHAGGGPGAVELERMNLVVDDPVYGSLLQLRAVPGLAPEATARMGSTDVAHIALPEGDIVLRKPALAIEGLRHGALGGAVSLRRAPTLAGIAAFEGIEAAALAALADPDDRDGDGISGRLAPGRYGWKAGMGSLREQVSRALSLDLGLGSPRFPAAAGDCTELQVECAGAAAGDGQPEVSAQMLDLILDYLRTLPAAPAAPGDEGAVAFAALGCGACHVPSLPSASGKLEPFSDFLLHDMGPGLDDGLAAPGTASAEWRTAPLRRLATNARFLHDGRAATPAEAILWHGGEAQASVNAYRALPADQRALLHAWLLGL